MIIKADLNEKFRKLIELLDIPRSYYEKAALRYQSLNDWFKRKESALARLDPAVYPQGSFRLGTVIRPLLSHEEYDLDIVCHLTLLGKTDMTQRQLKEKVGAEVKAYASSKGITAPVEERNRAWRLDYADEVNFHIDILPCAPEDLVTINILIAEHKVEPSLAASAVALTCKAHPKYNLSCSDWQTSNPVGFGTWFERRMESIAAKSRTQLVIEGQYDAVEHVPLYALKTVLQRTIQFLKRHRDVMFRDDPDMKPISMLISTLAAKAYNGEEQLYDALQGVLKRMPAHVHPAKPRVPNPVNPVEDFADKWAGNPQLEQNFWRWHEQATLDVEALIAQQEPTRLSKLVERRLGLTLSEAKARELTGKTQTASSPPSPPAVIVKDAPKPWLNADV